MASTTHHIRTIELGRAQLVALDSGRGDRVRVLCGSALLTQEGDVDDALLSPRGEAVLHDGRTLIEALQPSRLQIVSEGASARRGPRALVRRWRQRLQWGPLPAAQRAA